MKCRVHVGQCRAGGAGVQEDFGRGCGTGEDVQTGGRQVCGRRPRSSTHSRPAPASALGASCGCSSGRRDPATWWGPAAARPYTDPGPPGEACAGQKCPSSSASLLGSYSDPALQRTSSPVTEALTHAHTHLRGGRGLPPSWGGDPGPCPAPSLVLTDCHERVGELVLLFGRGQFVFERELLQGFTALQRLALPLTLHHLLQTQPHAHICRRRRPDVSDAGGDANRVALGV